MPFYRSIFVYNAMGTGVGNEREKWSFTVDVTVFTLGEIDSERLTDMEYYAEEAAQRIIDNSGLHNATFTTSGGELDREVESSMARGQGFYYGRLAVEDTDLADSDFRYRPDILPLIDSTLDDLESDGSLYYEGGAYAPRVSQLPKSISATIYEIIKRSRVENKARRRSRESKA